MHFLLIQLTLKIWLCEFEQQLANDPAMMSYIDTIETIDPLEPRDAFFGGRTNAIILDYKAADDEKILYADYVSLYPTVLKHR